MIHRIFYIFFFIGKDKYVLCKEHNTQDLLCKEHQKEGLVKSTQKTPKTLKKTHL